jgi:hypothetical protein
MAELLSQHRGLCQTEHSPSLPLASDRMQVLVSTYPAPGRCAEEGKVRGAEPETSRSVVDCKPLRKRPRKRKTLGWHDGRGTGLLDIELHQPADYQREEVKRSILCFGTNAALHRGGLVSMLTPSEVGNRPAVRQV